MYQCNDLFVRSNTVSCKKCLFLQKELMNRIWKSGNSERSILVSKVEPGKKDIYIFFLM